LTAAAIAFAKAGYRMEVETAYMGYAKRCRDVTTLADFKDYWTRTQQLSDSASDVKFADREVEAALVRNFTPLKADAAVIVSANGQQIGIPAYRPYEYQDGAWVLVDCEMMLPVAQRPTPSVTSTPIHSATPEWMATGDIGIVSSVAPGEEQKLTLPLRSAASASTFVVSSTVTISICAPNPCPAWVSIGLLVTDGELRAPIDGVVTLSMFIEESGYGRDTTLVEISSGDQAAGNRSVVGLSFTGDFSVPLGPVKRGDLLATFEVGRTLDGERIGEKGRYNVVMSAQGANGQPPTDMSGPEWWVGGVPSVFVP